ncbi:hypothetical protein IM816_05785 [Luteibacter flocculans]|uniref:Uncharacterized protein n=1 Tax=Luteibacter flocculans TaxID=2780091 RepID=A0ABY4T3Y6_9GAMM|nr:hypothetical protein [Luteibacter flocculans]URL59606.1 hypothetical protein IM816_05785 [Luteibacter flocculans]
MHTGKIIAMLNPKNCRFDIGSGGIPSLVSTDVAAALGMVPDGLGREILCRVWWPDGAKLTAHQLRELVDAKMRGEWARRESSMLDALLAVAQRGNRAQRTYSEAHAARWPRMVVREHEVPQLAPGYAKVRDAIITELASAGLCQACHGRGQVANDMRVSRTCKECSGEGHMRLSERSRADLCGFSWKTYREGWAGVYDWVFQACTDELHRAERLFQRALS